jgi:N-acetylglucosaminyldiphosphoundecaprenol N-acetyl-beta-D-mannosaminyltransferase
MSNNGRHRVDVLGCPIDALDVRSTVARCSDLITERRVAHHLSMNVAKLMALPAQEDLRCAVKTADVISADGQGVVWAARLLGSPLPERVTGIDLMAHLLKAAGAQGWRVYFLGARNDVLQDAVEAATRENPELVVAGFRDGYFDADEEEAVLAEVAAATPHLVFVGISSPKKEALVARNHARLAQALWVGVGGAFDILAGQTRRAPGWMQRAGVEWLYRLYQEPRRMWRRYLFSNSVFASRLGREVVARRILGRGRAVGR